MIVLGIESSSVTASCAISENNRLLGEYTLGHKKTHSEKLMPLIEKLMEDLGIKVQDVDVIAISEGPGSYTGLRIGAAIAKSIACAADIELVNVPTMKALAANIFQVDRLIVPIMDAKAGRIYSGIYAWSNESLTEVKGQFPCNTKDLIELLNTYEKPVVLNGDGSENYRTEFEQGLEIKPLFAPRQFNYLKASSLVCLGYEMASRGETVSPFEFAPKYLRLSQAERNKLL
jgi:tRNA threonylcarbamoyladenosine biosynthesis protein TsaB